MGKKEEEHRQQLLQKERDKENSENKMKQADSNLGKGGIEMVFRLKTPKGNFSRSFVENEDVDILFAWACSLEYDNCSINCAFPRIQSSSHKGKSLKDLKLGKQVALILEDLTENKDDNDDEDDDSDESSDDE